MSAYALAFRASFTVLLATQLGLRDEYQSASNFVTTTSRGDYQCSSRDNCTYEVDNACQRTLRGTPLVFDFIIVGSGAAGSTLARQLLDSPKKWKILLIEAGGDPAVDSVVPQFFTFNINNSNVWHHNAEPVSTSSRAFKKGTPMPYGKQLGGSTATNAMMYVCGNDRDFDGWATLGNTGWDYNSILPYIKKSEGNTDRNIVRDGRYHSSQGELTVTTYEHTNPIVPKMRQGFQELGYSLLSDYNSRQYNGFVILQGTVRGGERCSSYRAFIAPVKKNKNLYIMKHSRAVRILFKDTTATGVVVNTKHSDCPVIKLFAKKEVIISAGGLGSPKLLQLSGIGRAADLTPFKIKQIKDLNVGNNLIDHMYSINFFTLNPNATRQTLIDALFQSREYYHNRTGFLSFLETSNVQGIINTQSTRATYPDIQLLPIFFHRTQNYFAQILSDFGYKDKYISYLLDVNKHYDILMYFVVVLQPFSRGSVKLRSSNPKDDPLIKSGYYTDPRDVDTQIRGINKLFQLMNTKAMRSVSAKPLKMQLPKCNHLLYPSDDYWKCYIKYFSASLWHPSGTCKMGTSEDANAVVDPKLKVHGFTNLRVVDASIQPMITTGNTQCPTYMIAQKAADMIKAEWA